MTQLVQELTALREKSNDDHAAYEHTLQMLSEKDALIEQLQEGTSSLISA